MHFMPVHVIEPKLHSSQWTSSHIIPGRRTSERLVLLPCCRHVWFFSNTVSIRNPELNKRNRKLFQSCRWKVQACQLKAGHKNMTPRAAENKNASAKKKKPWETVKSSSSWGGFSDVSMHVQGYIAKVSNYTSLTNTQHPTTIPHTTNSFIVKICQTNAVTVGAQLSVSVLLALLWHQRVLEGPFH